MELKKNNQFADKMVRFQNGRVYSITMAPSDQVQFRSRKDRFFSYTTWLQEHEHEFFMGIKDCTLWPDLSFPTSMREGKYPRIHYHGVIEFKDILEFLLHSKIMENHTVEIDTIEDQNKWQDYCTKFKDCTNTNALPYVVQEGSDLRSSPDQKTTTILKYLS